MMKKGKIKNSEVTADSYKTISDKEMNELMPLFPSLRKGLTDAIEGRYHFVTANEKSYIARKYFKSTTDN